MTCTLVSKTVVADNATLFRVTRPKNYVFTPGQYAYVTVKKRLFSDYDHHRRLLSFASSPSSDTLDFLVRYRPSGFKKELFLLSIGEEIDISPAMGNFYPTPNRPNSAIVGGIGIAPILSLLKSDVNAGLTHLVWVNQTSASTPMVRDVTKLCQQQKIETHFLLTRQPQSRHPFTSTRLSKEWLLHERCIAPDTVYLLAGPPGMVKDVGDWLNQIGKLNIIVKCEAFTGYELDS